VSADLADISALIAGVPYARFLGLRLELAGDEMTAVMPYSQVLIGNPVLPAIHGGVLGALMEMTALVQIGVARAGDPRVAPGDARRLAKPIDITVEYLRSGRPVDTFARASIKRMGRRIANVHVEAWQEARGAPIATLHGHFLLPSEGPSPSAAEG
jgi:acyl-coenzyme A thioesterase PaaI-like protein